MDTRDAARRWARTWARAWPAQDADAIVALQAEDGDHWASMFRPYRGRGGLRRYLDESYAEDQPQTISGCTVVRFDRAGLVAEARDYSHVKDGHHPPPADLFG